MKGQHENEWRGEVEKVNNQTDGLPNFAKFADRRRVLGNFRRIKALLGKIVRFGKPEFTELILLFPLVSRFADRHFWEPHYSAVAPRWCIL